MHRYNLNIKNKARELRLQGKSFGVIAKLLECAESTVLLWTKDILLTEEQKQNLTHREPNDARSIANKNFHKKKRLSYQEIGKQRIKLVDPLYLAGCMLYWGEGTKSINQVGVCNSDINVLIIFKRFLTECFSISPEQLCLSINCHTDIRSVEEIENYWLEKLEINRSCLRKTTIVKESDKRKNNLSKKSRKLEYGVATLRICKTEMVQEIYGAIQEFANFKNDNWLNH
jgi:hypothetical protein